MSRDLSPRGKLLANLATAIAVMLVGAIDLVTGADIHVVSLYFVPLAFAGWRLGRIGAVTASFGSTLVWLGALFIESSHPVAWHVWAINFVTQMLAFLTVSMLVAVLCERLVREESLSRTDVLTGLANRHAFLERADQALMLCRRNARPASLAYIDLDNFKNANDRFGHAFGDALLRRCAAVIAATIRGTDVAARIGGDEFVILFPDTARDEATSVIARLVATIGTLAEFHAASVTASVGLVDDPCARVSVVDLIGMADAEMYLVKQRGKGNARALSIEAT